MEPKANYILIGAFTISVALLFLIFIIWLGGYAVDRDYRQYDVVFEEAVTGLTQSGAVMFNGIQVGDVQRLNVDPNDPARVIVRVRVLEGTPIRADTSATLGYLGFTGLGFIELEGGQPNSPMIEDISDQDIPVIIAETSGLQALLNNTGPLFESVSELVTRVTEVFSDENLENFSGSLSSVEATLEEVALHRASIGDTLEGLRAATDTANSMLGRLDTLASDVGNTWQSNKATWVADLSAITAQANAASAEANATMLRLKELFARNEPSIDEFAQRGLANVTTTLQDFQQLAGRLDALAAKLENNPGSILSGNVPEIEYTPSSAQ